MDGLGIILPGLQEDPQCGRTEICASMEIQVGQMISLLLAKRI